MISWCMRTTLLGVLRISVEGCHARPAGCGDEARDAEAPRVNGCRTPGRLQGCPYRGDPGPEAIHVQAQVVPGEAVQEVRGRPQLRPGGYGITHRHVVEAHGRMDEAAQEVPAGAHLHQP